MDIYDLSGIRTHDRSVRASEDRAAWDAQEIIRERYEYVHFCLRRHVHSCAGLSGNVFVFMAPYLSLSSVCTCSSAPVAAAVCCRLSCCHVEPRDVICVPSEFAVRMSIKAVT
jgi:hypothetical protein